MATNSSYKEVTLVYSFCCSYKLYKNSWDKKYIPSPNASMRVTMKGGLSEDTGRPWVMDPVKDPKNTYSSLAQFCPANGRWGILCAMTLGRGGI